ncbi:hypothetical protein [Halorussus litoreus]|nr:hypothetical protein [Halorussus litoreus]
MTNSSDHSEAVQEYIDIELESSFEFEERLSPDEDDPLFDEGRIVIDDSE